MTYDRPNASFDDAVCQPYRIAALACSTWVGAAKSAWVADAGLPPRSTIGAIVPAGFTTTW